MTKMHPGKALKKEAITRFGSTFDTVERFIVASAHVASFILSAHQEASKTANKAFDSIKCAH